MLKLIKFFSLLLFSLCLNQLSMAAEHGTAQEAEALVKKAINYIKSKGPEKAYAEFNSKGNFTEKDLYIFVIDMNGKDLAHGANIKLVGKDFRTLRDVDNKAFIDDILAMAGSKGKGWVDYKWPNPLTKEIELKSTYFEKAGDVVVACGIYK